jgi:hypothetical protein
MCEYCLFAMRVRCLLETGWKADDPIIRYLRTIAYSCLRHCSKERTGEWAYYEYEEERPRRLAPRHQATLVKKSTGMVWA